VIFGTQISFVLKRGLIEQGGSRAFLTTSETGWKMVIEVCVHGDCQERHMGTDILWMHSVLRWRGIAVAFWDFYFVCRLIVESLKVLLICSFISTISPSPS
jgi:hypothetical protein